MTNRSRPAASMRSTEAGVVARSAHVTRYPRWLYLVVSAVTVVWLLVQAVAVVIDNNHAYPVTAYSMFSRPSEGAIVTFELEATRPDGRSQPVPGEDFGLTPLQLRSYLVGEVGETPEDAHPRASDRLAELARIWQERHEAPLDDLTLWRTERHLDDPAARREVVATWDR